MPIKGNVIDYSIGLRQSAAAAFLLGLFYRFFFSFYEVPTEVLGFITESPFSFFLFFFGVLDLFFMDRGAISGAISGANQWRRWRRFRNRIKTKERTNEREKERKKEKRRP